ncbi:ABC transporter permease subunit [Devosia algicola]|uniref:ABC transporter permease subunit n=1 Tax=Devosia algicola TaxID=3026418 RepID=A0ABY7YP13_9HYPH|nr:ABC transporter permease subunit [Devosia algicola]WDR03059.1 ABC transporter permease subunit [Devosia algicola]
MLDELGVDQPPPLLGWTFSDETARSKTGAITRFLDASFDAKAVLRENDAVWEGLKGAMGANEDSALFRQLRDDYRRGIVSRYDPSLVHAAEQAFAVLAQYGGSDLVGSGDQARRRNLLDWISKIDTPATDKPARRAPDNRALEYLSLPLLLLVWEVLAITFPNRLFPTPVAVGQELWLLATQGKLLSDLIKTLLRASTAFVVAMVLGTVLGILLGRQRRLDRLFSSWLLVGLNLPAIVVAIVLYIWLGLTELALISAVVINKVPLVTTNIREGVRSFAPEFDELALALRLPMDRKLRLIFLPQLLPFVLASARTGLSLIWKIVLVFEVLGSDGGVGYRVSLFFQFFDITGILAYTTAFILVVMALEHSIIRPIEQKVMQWRPDPA